MTPTDDDPVDVIERALVRIRRSSTRRTLQRRTQPGAPPAAGALFMLLDALEPGGMTITQVATAIAVDQPRASRLAAQAEADGHVRKRRHPGDGRRTLVELTAAGRAVLTAAHHTRREAVGAALRDFSDDDAAAFARLLDRFVERWGH